MNGVLPLSTTQTILKNPNTTCAVAGSYWNIIEPSKDVYDFSQLDAAIAAIEALGLPIRLEVSNGGGFATAQASKPGWRKPAWLQTEIDNDNFAGCKYFEFIDPQNPTGSHITIPIWWEPTYLKCWSDMRHAVSAHLAGKHPLIHVVYLSYTSAQHDDWSFGDTSNNADNITDPCGTATTPHGRLLNAVKTSGFNTFEDAIIYVGKYFFGVDRDAFGPGMWLTTSVNELKDATLSPNGGTTGNYISDTIYNFAYGKGPVLAMKMNLNAKTPMYPPPSGGQYAQFVALPGPKALQMLAQNASDADTRTVGDIAKSYGCLWIELYPQDYVSYPDAVTYVHDIMTSGTGPSKVQKPTKVTKKRKHHERH